MTFTAPARTAMHACISASSGSVTCRLPAAHRPVLLTAIVAALDPHDGGVYVDGTFGAGGYSHAILEAADCTV